MRYFLLILIFLQLTGFSQQVINLDEAPSIPLKKELLGINTGLFYSDVMGERNENNVMINSYFSPQLIKEIDSISLGHIRFPGGNSANHYHFFGRGGYGTDTFELICREDFLPIPSIVNQYGINDGRHAENFAPRVKEVMQGLGKVNEAPDFHYIINIMTHFYYGDLKKLEEGLNVLILGRPKLLPYLFAKFNVLNATQFDEIANELKLITTQNKALFDLAKSNFMKEEGFRKRFDENLAAIHYYHDNNIPITHIEIGNEIYADFMLLDEDLSTITFDCSLADSSNSSINKLNVLNIQQYSLALLKYYFVSSLYEDSIKSAFPNTKTGLVLAPLRPNIVLNENLEIFEVPRNILSLNANYLWNKFVSGFEHGDGVITHLYLQNLTPCDAYNATNIDTVELVFEKILDFFINTSINSALELQNVSMNSSVKKEHWLTEWNMNGRNAASNTYMHAQFVLKFMLKILEWNKNNPDRKIDITSYFNLSTFMNFNYTMLRTGYDEQDVYHIEKQNLYYPIFYLSRAIQSGSKMIFTEDSIWNKNNNDSLNFYTFYNAEKEQLSLIYINHSKQNRAFSIDSTSIAINGKSNNYDITSLKSIQAKRPMATDYGCTQITPSSDEESPIKIENSNTLSKEVILSALSFGEIILIIEDVPTSIKSLKNNDFSIYPNPSKNYFSINTQNIAQANLNIFDIHGRLLISKSNITFPSEISHTLPSGNYILELNDGHNRWQKKLVVIQ